ncbi:hypothetical protein HOU02_gp056 [Caulobacter phage CcrBL9]|uniref:Uncharacterized protein n=1 Tax=Caulobacter phage CcrBL9 TaxID=2283270 RepID=A0A385EBQ3_9CAUD|nr:hypothetical protein HOU02_gp056 [Caulobacter phage CcrBL9]AXQ69080.1 hypothetical protein CcrBL9_gp056c [Caulobacter phage CcrBL9]
MSYAYNTYDELVALYQADQGSSGDLVQVLEDAPSDPAAVAALSAWKTLKQLDLLPLPENRATRKLLLLQLYTDMKRNIRVVRS